MGAPLDKWFTFFVFSSKMTVLFLKTKKNCQKKKFLSEKIIGKFEWKIINFTFWTQTLRSLAAIWDWVGSLSPDDVTGLKWLTRPFRLTPNGGIIKSMTSFTDVYSENNNGDNWGFSYQNRRHWESRDFTSWRVPHHTPYRLVNVIFNMDDRTSRAGFLLNYSMIGKTDFDFSKSQNIGSVLIVLQGDILLHTEILNDIFLVDLTVFDP